MTTANDLTDLYLRFDRCAQKLQNVLETVFSIEFGEINFSLIAENNNGNFAITARKVSRRELDRLPLERLPNYQKIFQCNAVFTNVNRKRIIIIIPIF